jgi:hypothetical protein
MLLNISNLFNKYKLPLVLLLLFIFFLNYCTLIDYGLPYFLNQDEASTIKAILYYFGIFSEAHQNLSQPIYAPFINFFIISNILFFKDLLFDHLTFAAIQNKIFFNPDIFVLYARLSSLIISTVSLFFFFLILKKIRIHIFIFIAVYISVLLSYFYTDLGIVAGKNSSLILIYTIQYYFFLKYYFKLKNFNIKSYIIFAVLGSIGFGVNYWAASPSIYAIIYLHYSKYKFKNFNLLLIYGFLFLFLAIIPHILLSSDNIFLHLFDKQYVINAYPDKSKIEIIFFKIWKGLDIIYIFEKILLVFFIFSFFFIKYLKILERRIFISNCLLIIEPIFLFSIADYSEPELRYLGPSIVLLHINIALVFSNFFEEVNLKNKFNKLFRILFTVLGIYLIFFSFYSKIQLIKTTKNILKKEYNQYVAIKYLEENNIINKTVLHFSALFRENEMNLNLYKNLLEYRFVSLNSYSDGKNNLISINKKINSINKNSTLNLHPNSKNYIFFGNEYIINNFKDYFNFLANTYSYYAVNKDEIELNNYLKYNFKIYKEFNSSNIRFARFITWELQKGVSLDDLKKINRVGEDIIIYKLN